MAVAVSVNVAAPVILAALVNRNDAVAVIIRELARAARSARVGYL